MSLCPSALSAPASDGRVDLVHYYLLYGCVLWCFTVTTGFSDPHFSCCLIFVMSLSGHTPTLECPVVSPLPMMQLINTFRSFSPSGFHCGLDYSFFQPLIWLSVQMSRKVDVSVFPARTWNSCFLYCLCIWPCVYHVFFSLVPSDLTLEVQHRCIL